ncbi:uncharacterized protein LOC115026669 isoform X1 [Cottoperca gobio]|uniref:Uncharacterized protein LOC115026669 isoform X1 n=1 Tax=Cottoperca gobio TaxID=56716 RepID=A0A6J2RYK5_COTGO|nr:uncharacterized protein LOC115026669 isoform X1 [Cottoperca gobio]
MPCGPCAQIHERSPGWCLQTGFTSATPAPKNTASLHDGRYRLAMEGSSPADSAQIIPDKQPCVPKATPRRDGLSCVQTSAASHHSAAPRHSAAGLGSRVCGCCQLLSRQCRSCVAISSYIWLLGLRRLCLLPGRACPFHSHWLVAHSDPLIGCGVGWGAPSCDPTDRMFSVSQLHKGPLSRLFVCFFLSFLFRHSFSFSPSLLSRALSLKLLFVKCPRKLY